MVTLNCKGDVAISCYVYIEVLFFCVAEDTNKIKKRRHSIKK